MSAVLQTPAPSLHATGPGPGAGRWRGFATGAREIDDAPVAVAGSLPGWLRGRMLLNGPALWELPEGGYRHWFDGLAMLHSVHIGEGGVRYRSRYLQSEDYRLSVAARKPAMGGFATDDPPGLWRRLKGVVAPQVTDNAAVVMSRIGSQWVATTETPHMVGFDSESLATTGPLQFDDGVQLHLMSAHGIVDARGSYWNVGVQFGPSSIYKVFRIRPGAMKREVVGSIKTSASGYLHGFAMSARHAFVWETAFRAQPLGFMFTGNAYIRNFRWQPEKGSLLHAVSLDDGRVTSWSVPSMMCFHAVQAYERGDELVVEAPVFENADIFDEFMLDKRRRGDPLRSQPTLTRYRLQRGRSDAVVETFGAGMDLPQVHPSRWTQREAMIAWGAGMGGSGGPAFFDSTLRIDIASGAQRAWRRGDAVQLEPVFLPRPGGEAEDDGVLLVPTLADDDAATVLAVVDASTMESLATMTMPQVIPFGFHANFVA